ncbi:MAG: DUF1064 domain-containing protein [Patescibacteria group bacterium]|nr:DUF1064 domain-containing protein [Patescibacteria group bacterium]
MTFNIIKKGVHYHRYFVDVDTNDLVCLCGAVKKQGEKMPRKFHNRTTEYNGIQYHSKLEARYAADLDWRVRSKDIASWDRQVKISFDVCPECARLNTGKCPEHPTHKQFHITNYYIDFVIHHNDGDTEYAECKGMELTEWKTKWHMMEAIYGKKEGIRLTVVKESNQYQWSRLSTPRGAGL